MVTLHRDDVDRRWCSRLPAANLPYNWAHPWPTWSRLSSEHVDDRWDVQAAVPLRAVFVVDQAAQDRVAPAGAGEAVGLLLEVARQASRRLWVGATPDELRAFHARRFENL